MSVEFSRRLRRFADVIVRVGLNLREGQPVLLAEPFELQGVSREAAPLVDAITESARAAGASSCDVIWGDAMRWREAAQRGGDRLFERELVDRANRMRIHARRGGALVFLPSSHPGLMDGIAAAAIAAVREAGWRAYGRVAPDLIAGRTNWTTAPAPTGTWAAAVYPELTAEAALERLWEVVFAACRVDATDPLAAWRIHLAELGAQRDALNARRVSTLRFVGDGFDLKVVPARGHIWCTACLRTADGRPFVANLPTEEIFTAPDRDATEGFVRMARPVAYGGGIIAGAELEFRAGRVVRAQAAEGNDLLQRLLQTDRGAARLGEIAIVPCSLPALTEPGRCFQHVLLDENALDHIALGEAYPFTVNASGSSALNHSLVHVDLPVAATVRFDDDSA